MSYFCYNDSLLSWCPDHHLGAEPSQPTTTPPSLYTELNCDLMLATLHILGLRPCDAEATLPPLSSQMSKQHLVRPASAKSIFAGLHRNIFDDIGEWKTQSTPRSIRVYPTTPIDEVGQPIISRLIRETIGSRAVGFFGAGLQLISNLFGSIVSNLSQLITTFMNATLPIKYQSRLKVHGQPQVISTLLLSADSPPLPGGQTKQLPPSSSIPNNFKVPSAEFLELGQSTIPADTIFFAHIPTGLTSTTIYPITFTLAKAAFLLIWFIIHLLYFFVKTRFQSKFSPQLQQIWDNKQCQKTTS